MIDKERDDAERNLLRPIVIVLSECPLFAFFSNVATLFSSPSKTAVGAITIYLLPDTIFFLTLLILVMKQVRFFDTIKDNAQVLLTFEHVTEVQTEAINEDGSLNEEMVN